MSERSTMKRCARVLVAVAGLASLAATGCGSEPRVVRVYDGRIVQGRYVSPEAYAAFLRGALAEEAGDLKGAAVAYGQAAGEDDEDPEVFARLGEVRCKLDPKDGNADRAFGRALTLDAGYAGALAAWSRCADARGRSSEALDLARRAVSEDPKNVELQALVVRGAAAREQAVALTLAHGEIAAAWDALGAWGRSHRDAELVARALEGLVHAAPMRSLEVEKGAVALLVGGELALARRVASVLVDSPREMGVLGPRDATVARLAVDEALVRGDRLVAVARATRGHVALAEVAARALVQGQREIAAAIATQVTEADPGASGAAMVKASLQGATSGFAHVTDQPPELCALVFADRLATAAGTDVARQWLARITRTPMSSRDPVAGPLAVDLAARGVLPVTDLPEGLRASAQHARAAE
jgi:tetratricopeptide (TPR) repeat protein